MKLLPLILFLLAANLRGSEIPLAWDASPSSNVTYRVYASTNGLPSTNAISFNVGTNLTATASNLLTGTYTFAVSAVSAQGIESELSNKLVVEVPEAPKNMRTVIVQTAFEVGGPYTNNLFIRIGFP